MSATSPAPVLNTSRLPARNLPRLWLTRATHWLWQWLRRPWLAIAAGIIVIMLALAVWQLPQLPGQLVDAHAATATWLLNTSSSYGIWGNALLALGLFDVVRSPLLYLLLALLVPTLAAQLADQLGALQQHRQIHTLPINTPAANAGLALPLPAARPLFRWRGTLHIAPNVVIETLADKLARDASHLRRENVAADVQLEALDDRTGAPLEESAPATEARIVAMRQLRLQYVRPLLMVGLLISVAGAWLALAFGWQITSPPLAPGATFRAASRNLTLQYTAPLTATGPAEVVGHLQGIAIRLPADQPSQVRTAAATIQVRPAYPAVLMVVSDQQAQLTLPGDPTARAHLGLVFAVPGSEESVLIPQQGLGLRIVQLADSNAFVLELYRSDAIQPIYRAELTPGGRVTVPLDSYDTTLVVSSQPGLRVDVRHLPGLWLVPVGLLLTLVGALAFMRQSNFVVTQVAPWGEEASVVIMQSDQPQVIEKLRADLEQLTHDQLAHDQLASDQLAQAEHSSIM